jgi:hypothetical protein
MSTHSVRLQQELSEIRALLHSATVAKGSEDRRSLP